jgi:hypothetical protein
MVKHLDNILRYKCKNKEENRKEESMKYRTGYNS